MRDDLREGIRNANIVLAVMCPAYAVTAILLRDAGEEIIQGVALAYLLASFAFLLALNNRSERRRRRESRDQ